jgi:hypothetical protein
MLFDEVRDANASEKENSNAFHFKGPTYTKVSTIEGLQPEPELQREQEDMVQKLNMLKEVVLRSNQVEELPSSIHLER